MKKVEKLYLETFREIRSYIINNGLKPGDMLPTEQAMCERWGVSRNVLREAIKSMELMGMVQACPGRGTQVKDFNLDFIFQNVLFFNMGDPEDDARVREMFGIRKMLELGYMRQAFKALSGEDIAYMRKCAGNMRELGKHGRIQRSGQRIPHGAVPPAEKRSAQFADGGDLERGPRFPARTQISASGLFRHQT